MRFGYLALNDAGGIRPDVLARELEQRGFDSVWMPEHSHIPASRDTPYPGGGDLPNGYWQMMDPFVSLMAAASATTTLKLCTGICLLLEHDLLDLAVTVASLDVLSAGRVVLGVGVGWNVEELRNHRPDLPFAQRYSAMRERVAALRSIWTEDEPQLDGRWDRFSASWVYPKPQQQPVPIALGNAGPTGIRHAASYADMWCPIDASLLNTSGRPDVDGGVQLFRELAVEAGRDPAQIPITIFAWNVPKPARLAHYAELGIERVVLPPPSMSTVDAAATLRYLDSVADTVAELDQPA
jgi:probable F420-dependent oxidoreductase